MAVISIKTISKVLANSPVGRKMFKFGIRTILYVLEAQRLIDWKKLEEISLDWEKGTINFGDGFTEMLTGRAISEYVWDRKKSTNRRLSAAELSDEIQKSVSKHTK